MDRPDLHSAFTKIVIWRHTEFRKIVYMDADMVALRAPDELFSLTHDFSAAPDIGWPDAFNSGLMVLSPNMGDYYALSALAERGVSWDGADQGLLNTHFGSNYNRLPFTYNVTPSASYQYLPAFTHFKSQISAVHFIGKDKPWKNGRETHGINSAYDELVGRWWAVYDRHFRARVCNFMIMLRRLMSPGIGCREAHVLAIARQRRMYRKKSKCRQRAQFGERQLIKGAVFD
jgi:glycogenin glucosyltransferase